MGSLGETRPRDPMDLEAAVRAREVMHPNQGEKRMSDVPRYTLAVTVTDKDIDGQDHVNNVAFLRFVQDAAAAHWVAIAPPDIRAAFTWVVRRHEIEYLRLGLPGDQLTVRTWVGEPSGATWERFTEILPPERRNRSSRPAPSGCSWMPRRAARAVSIPTWSRASGRELSHQSILRGQRRCVLARFPLFHAVLVAVLRRLGAVHGGQGSGLGGAGPALPRLRAERE